MLLIDGVKYELWTPSSEDEFEQVVKEHAQDIFGEQSIYLDRKQKLKSLSGIGSIPDGYVIVFGGSPEWHIVEVELSSHPLHEHIVPQVGKFIGGISNPNIQRVIVNAIDEQIKRDDFLMLRLREAIEPVEIHRFLADLVSKQPIITIIIEKETEELREALNILRYHQIEVVEFQTFVREGVGLPVHAHLFEPLDVATLSVEPKVAILYRPIKAETGYRRRKVVVSPTGEKLSRTKFVERFASESERKESVTNERYPYVMVDTQAKFEAFLAKHPECAGWTLCDNT